MYVCGWGWLCRTYWNTHSAWWLAFDVKPSYLLHAHPHNPWCCYASLFSSLSLCSLSLTFLIHPSHQIRRPFWIQEILQVTGDPGLIGGETANRLPSQKCLSVACDVISNAIYFIPMWFTEDTQVWSSKATLQGFTASWVQPVQYLCSSDCLWTAGAHWGVDRTTAVSPARRGLGTGSLHTKRTSVWLTCLGW